ncbi:hypothetical protein [Agromyces sp. Marseille-P2726]|uniref:hypothetical protein n=1 Tax=Agromyces sp. Marseille-P2726 TaxID=2709132 RepID=UPI00156EFF48|nr:hypothetical protein [Agromyces sp. Marseille-P2726]
MQQSAGRTEAPTTETAGPEVGVPDDLHHVARDVTPAAAYDDPADAAIEPPPVRDPLDPRKPSRASDDPLDPGSHVI